MVLLFYTLCGTLFYMFHMEASFVDGVGLQSFSFHHTNPRLHPVLLSLCCPHALCARPSAPRLTCLSLLILCPQLYFAVITLTTVGFGDEVTNDPTGQAFCIVYVLLGVMMIAVVLGQLNELQIDGYQVYAVAARCCIHLRFPDGLSDELLLYVMSL